MAATTRQLGSSCETLGWKIDVRPEFLPEQSHADSGKFVFGYRVRITNNSHAPATLVSRHWLIVDADGERHEVVGEGVVGQQPRLQPGQHFDYDSFCPLSTPWGTMEGTYVMRSDEDQQFTIKVARFFLVAHEHV
ncbi:MAG: Co2+/Mg2+ efflux protein ApaG [Tepidisphaera sp.]|nr:Co2+/Mg2+ efflux protein ApaG [Tepidisphaera sp.]